MKKFIALMMSLVLVCALVACGKKTEDNNQGADQTVSTAPEQGGETAPQTTPEATPEAPAASAMESLPADATIAQTVIADFTDKMNSKEFANIEDLANAMMEGEYIPFGPMVMPVVPGYLNGFSAEINGFNEGVNFGPMIGSIPFVGYILTTGSAAEADTLVATLKDAADLRWNICTSADEMLYTVIDNNVCFVMGPTAIEE